MGGRRAARGWRSRTYAPASRGTLAQQSERAWCRELDPQNVLAAAKSQRLDVRRKIRVPLRAQESNHRLHPGDAVKASRATGLC
jgi:hypothetical protein